MDRGQLDDPRLPRHQETGRYRMSPKQVVQEWVARFNAGDADGLAELYAADATNHQVVMEPLRGREAIRDMFRTEFGRAEMTCLVENLFEDGEWAILEWTDPNGLRGCGFFQVRDDRIVFQRGYFDQLSFFRLQGLPVPSHYLGT
jgi:limonene-1,2-epoxide hydrolase